ncbi:hypothetical protein EYE40_13825 [Glaciihabitans arcticus]|uniref:Uncharacterized protein n=1 Tax=Glaciihabitans arcticus TaxID=2668039 RepID=A0A4Q9GZV4_9MICO|nr:hypothetical protein [Glaciihabitans arcticus]TBN58383.1 hypothetical protein EYE40_13825 [Glaciihabitans arcticus]
MKLRIAVGLLVVLASAGCTAQSPSDPVPSAVIEPEVTVNPTPEAYTTAVEQQAGDCFAELGVTQPLSYVEGNTGMKMVGVVSAEGSTGPLSWDVGRLNAGGIIVEPRDEQTRSALESAGC